MRIKSYACYVYCASSILLIACSGGGGDSGSSAPAKITVDATASAGGSITPSSQAVARGTQVTFSLLPSTGYRIASVTGCGGSLSFGGYVTAPIHSNCTVNAVFEKLSYAVTSSLQGNGAIHPATGTVLHGEFLTFNVNPSQFNELESISGCDGKLNASQYTTGPITSPCEISAKFKKSFEDIAPVSKTILLVVDPKILPHISSHIESYSKHVAIDTGATVRVISSPNDAEEIRSLFLHTHDLWGAILIGDVPVTEEVMYSNGQDYSYVTDHIFRSPDCPYTFSHKNSDGNFTYVAQSNFSVTLKCEPKYWISRIKPTGGSKPDKISKYLENNIKNRSTIRDMSLTMNFVSALSDQDGAIAHPDFSTMNHRLFGPENFRVQKDKSSVERKNFMKECLHGDRNVCKVSAHGSPNSIAFIGSNSEDVSHLDSAEVAGWQLHSPIVEIESCSTGKFTHENYLASVFLFSGNSIFVKANPMDSGYFSDALSTEAKYRYFSLGFGLSDADIYTRTSLGTPSHFLGDPTFLWKSAPNDSEPTPVAVFNGKRYIEPFSINISAEVNFGETVEKEVIVKNYGNAPLRLLGKIPPHVSAFNEQPPSCLDKDGCPFYIVSYPQIALTLEQEHMIPEGQSLTLRFQLKGKIEDASGTFYAPRGKHESIFRYVSNDPRVGPFDVHFTVFVK